MSGETAWRYLREAAKYAHRPPIKDLHINIDLDLVFVKSLVIVVGCFFDETRNPYTNKRCISFDEMEAATSNPIIKAIWEMRQEHDARQSAV